MTPVVITTGQRFTDLDALACIIAYCEIDPSNLIPVIPGPLNHSVTQTIRKWGLKYKTQPPPGVTDYVIMDISEDKYIANFVDITKVVSIYDHHFGFENIWLNRPWVKTTIEEIGACATLVWEEIKKKTINPPISPLSAALLYTAIVTHTLNFKISITKDRDRQAAQEIKSFTSLPDNWISLYYREIEADIYRDPVMAITHDTKIANLGGQTIAIGQMEMWLPENFVKDQKAVISSTMRQFDTELWLFSAPGISQGINYLFTDNHSVKEWLKMRIGANFDKNSDIGTTSRLWLRKEILRELNKEVN